MLNEKEQLQVKQDYIKLLKEVTRKDCDIEGFIAYLEDTGFFTAPASTQYHCSFPGGLCLHSINVVNSLLELNKQLDKTNQYSRETLILVGLLHDLDKIGKYERATRNEKVYGPDGDKKDSLGTFKLVSVESYKVADANVRKNLGNKGFAAYMIASMFFALSHEEVYALMYQYSAVANEQLTDLSKILSKYNLCVLLHSADIITTYCIEK